MGKHAFWTASFQCLAKSRQRGHETQIDFLWVLFLVGRIGPLMKVTKKLEKSKLKATAWQTVLSKIITVSVI